jgi:hypothetical protein
MWNLETVDYESEDAQVVQETRGMWQAMTEFRRPRPVHT